MPKEWNREVFFHCNDVCTNEQSQKAKKNQGMHHARMAILEDFLLAEGLQRKLAGTIGEGIKP